MLAGRILAAPALPADDRWAANGLIRLPHTRLPPEPLRYLGGLAVRTAIARKEAAEGVSRPAGRLTGVARLARPNRIRGPRMSKDLPASAASSHRLS